MKKAAEKIIEQIKIKISNCSDKKEGRIRKGAYADCIMIIKEIISHED